ncbi:MAG: anaerobic glycerol-3-phosphate dehydrogenase subunit C [Candidatus Rokubacteria bacterium]|nr:anaerobic glycerol-3-phosphate dehydrogenase subunit C [Candidatus Rokubacteria bacterium]
MTLDIRAPDFWQLGKVDAELRRVFDICNGCRRCITLCPSFKDLFQSLDAEAVDGDAEKLPGADLRRVVDLCYQCKLCFNHCPYTPPHRWQVDFPRLMLRSRAARARTEGVTLQDRFLGNTAFVGKLGSLTAPLSNWANRWGAHRAFLQAVVGIHKDRNLPRFHRETFSRWFARRRPASFSPQARVALFATCAVEYNNPAVGKAAAAVLERNGVDVTLPPQRCCGMPYLDGGAVAEAQALIRENVRALAAAVREGREIVVPGPTCSYMLKQEYPWLDGSEDARLVASHTRDLFEFLMRLHAEGKLETSFVGRPGTVAYQLPCHLKAQNLGTKSADLLRLIPGARVEVIERCAGVDGTWGLKRQYYELSLAVARPLFKEIEAARPDRIATDCPLAALQIAQGTGTAPQHPVQILAEAYGFTVE